MVPEAQHLLPQICRQGTAPCQDAEAAQCEGVLVTRKVIGDVLQQQPARRPFAFSMGLSCRKKSARVESARTCDAEQQPPRGRHGSAMLHVCTRHCKEVVSSRDHDGH